MEDLKTEELPKKEGGFFKHMINHYLTLRFLEKDYRALRTIKRMSKNSKRDLRKIQYDERNLDDLQKKGWEVGHLEESLKINPISKTFETIEEDMQDITESHRVFLKHLKDLYEDVHVILRVEENNIKFMSKHMSKDLTSLLNEFFQDLKHSILRLPKETVDSLQKTLQKIKKHEDHIKKNIKKGVDQARGILKEKRGEERDFKQGEKIAFLMKGEKHILDIIWDNEKDLEDQNTIIKEAKQEIETQRKSITKEEEEHGLAYILVEVATQIDNITAAYDKKFEIAFNTISACAYMLNIIGDKLEKCHIDYQQIYDAFLKELNKEIQHLDKGIKDARRTESNLQKQSLMDKKKDIVAQSNDVNAQRVSFTQDLKKGFKTNHKSLNVRLQHRGYKEKKYKEPTELPKLQLRKRMQALASIYKNILKEKKKKQKAEKSFRERILSVKKKEKKKLFRLPSGLKTAGITAAISLAAVFLLSTAKSVMFSNSQYSSSKRVMFKNTRLNIQTYQFTNYNQKFAYITKSQYEEVVKKTGLDQKLPGTQREKIAIVDLLNVIGENSTGLRIAYEDSTISQIPGNTLPKKVYDISHVDISDIYVVDDGLEMFKQWEIAESYYIGWPILNGVITSLHGARVHPILGLWKYHFGTDLDYAGAKKYIPIKSIMSGKVVYIGGNHNTRGYTVYVHNEESGITIGYFHLKGRAFTFINNKQTSLKVGDKVIAGETVGYVGNTGLSTRDHLHIEAVKFTSHYSYSNVETHFKQNKGFKTGGNVKRYSLFVLPKPNVQAAIDAGQPTNEQVYGTGRKEDPLRLLEATGVKGIKPYKAPKVTEDQAKMIIIQDYIDRLEEGRVPLNHALKERIKKTFFLEIKDENTTKYRSYETDWTNAQADATRHHYKKIPRDSKQTAQKDYNRSNKYAATSKVSSSHNRF